MFTISVSENTDKTKNISVDTSIPLDYNHKVKASVFVAGQSIESKSNNSNALSFKAVGGSLGVENAAGHSLDVSAQHVPKFGNHVTASAKYNVLKAGDHKVDAKAFTTYSMPKDGENFTTYGAGVDYSYKGKYSANAGISQTPKFKQTGYTLGANANVIKKPYANIDLCVSARRKDTSSGPGNWEKDVTAKSKKSF